MWASGLGSTGRSTPSLPTRLVLFLGRGGGICLNRGTQDQAVTVNHLMQRAFGIDDNDNEGEDDNDDSHEDIYFNHTDSCGGESTGLDQNPSGSASSWSTKHH